MVNRIEPMVLHRRALLGSALAGLVAVAAGCGVRLRSAAPSTESNFVAPAVSALAQLERQFDGRLGVCAIDTGSGVSVSYRAEERFLMCSTGKVLSVAAIQHLASSQPGLLDQLIEYAQSDILKWAPATSQHVVDGMTVAALCDAAITMSDNTAANLLVELLGDPQKVTAFARSIGDQITSVDCLEPELNVGAPGDIRDTSTPAQMAANLRTLVVEVSVSHLICRGGGWPRRRIWSLHNATCKAVMVTTLAAAWVSCSS